ncbi:MAG: TonB-dependent receptor domain-containing protein [bacterium]
MKSRYIFIFVGILFFWTNAFAGTTGKISGTVKDAQNGEPLPGVNVVIEGTSMGAATDMNGFFFIINVPPGKYTIKASMMGYETQSQVGVKVVTDITTKVDFKLTATVLEVEAVTLVAERPAIQKDLTSSLQAFAGDEINRAPVENLVQLLETQAGVSPLEVTERAGIIRDTPGDGLHIRGGRENETAYLLDGVRVDNPMWGGADYAQNTSGSSVTEMMTVLGTFNAEYGGKMSGVINLVTKEGTDKYSGQISSYTDNFGIRQFDRNTFQSDVTLSGPVPVIKGMTFFTNAQIRTTDGRFRGFIIPNWTDSKGQVALSPTPDSTPYGGFEGFDEFPTDWERVSADWKDEWNAMLKVNWQLRPNLKLLGSYVHSHVKKAKYYHQYKYLPFSMPWSDSKSDGFTFKLTHMLSPSTFYELRASNQRIDYWLGVNKTREQRIVMGSRLSEPVYGFYYSGARNNYWADTTRTYQIAIDVTSQVTRNHLLKAGVDVRILDMFHRLENAWSTPVDEIVVGTDEEGNLITKSFESHKAYADSRPIEWAGYLQDKMEFESIGMILNAGVRFERWSIGEQYMENPDIPMETPLLPTQPKTRVSPRLGISYPISDKAAFHFAYGHFYQFPSYVDLLSGVNEKGRYPDRPNLQDIGLAIFNPNVNPEKSVTYEAGVQTELMTDVSLNITAFYRELADLVGVTWVQTAGYVYFDNVDFGNSKGLELTLNKRFSNYFSSRINYTVSQTLISTSSPMTAAQTVSSAPIAYRSFLADWDRTHDLAALVLVSDPKSWAISLNAKLKSGRPYSVLAEQKNTERMPWNVNVDLKLSKYFKFFGFKETFYVQIYNVLDRRNIYSVFKITGKWDDDGDPGTPYAYDANPRRISDGRRVRIGFRISF